MTSFELTDMAETYSVLGGLDPQQLRKLVPLAEHPTIQHRPIHLSGRMAALLEICERDPALGYRLLKHLIEGVSERLDATRSQLTHRACCAR